MSRRSARYRAEGLSGDGTSAQTYLKHRAEHEVVEVWQKDPSTAAFRELMAHAIDLPKQQEQELRLTAEWRQLVAILRSARARPPQD